MSELLFEIGTEEIPARFLPEIEKNLTELLVKELSENRIETASDSVKVMSTFRRIAIEIQGFEDQQADLSKEVKGPPLKVAVDAAGAWTKAAIGFASTNKVPLTMLVQKEGYVWANVHEKGSPTRDLIAGLIKNVLQKLHLPIAMHWGYEKQTFIRPVHWIVFLWNGEIVDFEFAGIKSGNKTRGHRIFGARDARGWAAEIQVSGITDYKQKLKEQFVIVDSKERKDIILKSLLAKQSDGLRIHCNQLDELLSEVTYLTEFPVVVAAEFDSKYLIVPNEVLSTTMTKNQKYFPSYLLVDGVEKMTSKYFIVADGATPANTKNIILGNNKVLTARLEDAKFFYEEDQKHPLTGNIAKLKNILYHEKIGTLYQKLERVFEIAKWLSKHVTWKDQREYSDDYLREATFLLKADLVSKVVYEFPELQGRMGSLYAKKQGNDSDICGAIEQHYWPKGNVDDNQQIPTTQLAQLLSLAEKLDTIVGCYSIGIIPKGSSDPYALRRAAQGIVHLIDGFKNPLNCTLDLLVTVQFVNTLFQTEVTEPVVDFIWGRFRNKCENVISWDGVRPTYDILDAVLAVERANMTLAAARLECMRAKKEDPQFRGLVDAAVRVGRLAAKAEVDLIDPKLFEHQEETDLYNSYLSVKSQNQTTDSDYEKVYQNLLTLVDRISGFFDKVMVMAENVVVRNNRLALLMCLDREFKRIADFEKIVI